MLDHAEEQLDASLTLASTNQGRAADLVQDRRRALIVRRIDHVAFECGDRLQFTFSSDQTELAAAVGCCDGGGISQVYCR